MIEGRESFLNNRNDFAASIVRPAKELYARFLHRKVTGPRDWRIPIGL